MKACRDGYGDALMELGKKVICVTADLSPSVRMKEYRKKYPKNYFDVGVAEQNLVTIASGMAHMGKVVFASSFGAFSPGRNWEQIRTTIAYNDNNVKIVSTHCGLNVGEDGATHQVLEDIALMRSLPNMVVIEPCCYKQAKEATKAIAKYKGPAYMRMGRAKVEEIKTPKFKIGKAQVLRKGNKGCIIACGPVINEALKATETLKCRVINMHTIKPLDVKAVKKAVKECGNIITIEDHQINGGLGSAVSEVVAEMGGKVKRLGVNDQFGESGDGKEVMKKYGLTAKNILKYKKFLKSK